MPVLSRAQNALRSIFQRSPGTASAVLRLLDLWYQVALLPFRRFRRTGTATEDESLVRRTDAYVEAAERYFAGENDSAFLVGKPFSEPAATSKHLIDAGVLVAAMRLVPGDIVLEIGAGSCWLSHMLNRYGCPTISVDVSPTVLALGRRMFESDSRTDWSLAPRFVAYDGHVLPLEDGSCDRIVMNDAFHHVPNQRELLTEMYRVLRSGGVVAMSEPGRGHAAAGHSVEEACRWGVLENELVIEDLAALARDCGFAHVNAIVSSPFVQMEVDAHELGAFMGGKGFAAYWKALCSALEQHHYIVCYKNGQGLPTTRRPTGLLARIEVEPGHGHRWGTAPQPVRLRIRNMGQTTWIGGAARQAGWTRAGAHLYRGSLQSAAPDLVNFDWWRCELPSDVAPGQEVTIDAVLPALPQGEYVLVFDLVVEGLTWFAAQGSGPARIALHVS
jgi:SAM-dependent methyltransferase